VAWCCCSRRPVPPGRSRPPLRESAWSACVGSPFRSPTPARGGSSVSWGRRRCQLSTSERRLGCPDDHAAGDGVGLRLLLERALPVAAQKRAHRVELRHRDRAQPRLYVLELFARDALMEIDHYSPSVSLRARLGKSLRRSTDPRLEFPRAPFAAH